MRSLSVLAAILLYFGTTATSVQAIVVDDFSVGPIHLERNAGVAVTATQTGLDPAHVLGGQRDIVLGRNYSNGQVLDIDTTEQRLTLSAGPSPALAGLELIYGSRTTPLGADLTAAGHDRFVLDFDGSTASLIRMVVTSRSGAALIEDAVSVSSYYDGKKATIPFAEFSGVDFTNVASVELEFFRHRGTTLRSIYTIPEPLTAWLLTGAAIVCAGTRFRV